ncbi:MAG: deoxyribose-phosphate aldolase [Clostridia bacterium]|nr:deoxyribose-phosphate aldolase [Clostridia bacterium]
MEIKEILARVDHTILSPTATWDEVKQVLEDAWQMRCASACIPPSHVHKAADYMEGSVKICTVIGFPNGYSTTRTKCYEAAEAVTDGADEVDMVINLGWLKSGEYDRILEEIRAVRKAVDAVRSGVILKVIVETCLLTENEKIRMCQVVSRSGADYIKTSTGFSAGGAAFEDIALMKQHVTGGVKIKAAGGISTLDDAVKFIELGADRLGTSRIVKLVRGMKTEDQY